MSSHSPAVVDVAVVGGGIIGLAVAWRARLRGLSVALFERGAIGGQCASGVAAGMLAPVSEVEFGEAGRDLLELGLRSARMWPSFAAELEDLADREIGLRSSGTLLPACDGDEARELEDLAGREIGLRASGTLLVARDGDEARELERHIALLASLGVRATRLRPSAARELEPALAPTVRLALEAPDDHSVDPRLVLAALRRACEQTGVSVREHLPVARVELDGPQERVVGVTLADGRRVSAGQVVLAAGAWTAEVEGLPKHARVPVRPVKGQILRLRDPAGPGLLRRVIRFEGGYIVPRDDGGYVVGATVEERGFEDRPTAGGVYELLRAARELVPGILELQIEELSVGFRPSSPDNAPLIGSGVVDGLVWATGHHRNGILLAPLTAELVADLLSRSGPSDIEDRHRALLLACDPSRFGSNPGHPTRTPTGPPLGVLS